MHATEDTSSSIGETRLEGEVQEDEAFYFLSPGSRSLVTGVRPLRPLFYIPTHPQPPSRSSLPPVYT